MADYSVIFDEKSAVFLNKLAKSNPKVAKIFLQKFKDLQSNPTSGKPLKANWKGYYKLRAIDYRAIYEINEKSHQPLLRACRVRAQRYPTA